jgi:hypothetical protein
MERAMFEMLNKELAEWNLQMKQVFNLVSSEHLPQNDNSKGRFLSDVRSKHKRWQEIGDDLKKKKYLQEQKLPHRLADYHVFALWALSSVTERRIWRRYFRRRFRFDVQRGRCLRDARLEFTQYEAVLWSQALQYYFQCECLIEAGLLGICKAMREGTLTEATVAAAAQKMDETFSQTTGFFLLWPLISAPLPPILVENSLFNLSGWVASRINLDKNLRLRKALAKECGSSSRPAQFEKLRELLPSYISVALTDEESTGEELTDEEMKEKLDPPELRTWGSRG